MKKHKNIVIVLLSVWLFFGCQSIQQTEDRNPYSFFDSGFDAYVCIPVQQNVPLIESFFQTFFYNVPESFTTDILKRTHVIYVAIDFTNKDFQAVVFGNFPSSLIPLVCTPKNGWQKDSTNGRVYKNTLGISMTVPKSNSVLISRKSIESLTARFENPVEQDFPQDVANLLYGKSTGDIYFYIARGADFAQKITGPFIQLPLDYFFGKMSALDTLLEYNLSVSLHYSDERAIPANILLLQTLLKALPFADISNEPVIVRGENKNILITNLAFNFAIFMEAIFQLGG